MAALSRCTLASLALLLAVHLFEVDAGYYGGYRRGHFGGGRGVTVTKQSQVHIQRGGRGYYGRRLLQEPDQTMLQIVESRDDLSMLKDVIQDLPKVKEALGDPGRDDTFFAPTNDAIRSLTEWAGFEDAKEGLKEMLGNNTVKALIIAYHAVPDKKLDSGALSAMDGEFLESALGNVLDTEAPLEVDEQSGEISIKGKGSEAKVVEADVPASNGVMHLIDAVLLPLDGDGELDEEQKKRIELAKQKMQAAMAKGEDSADTDTTGDDTTEQDEPDTGDEDEDTSDESAGVDSQRQDQGMEIAKQEMQGAMAKVEDMDQGEDSADAGEEGEEGEKGDDSGEGDDDSSGDGQD